jgi:hypothetical protein
VALGEAGGAGPHRWRWLVDGEGSLVEAGGGGVGGTSWRRWRRPQGSGAGPPGGGGTTTWATSVWAAAVAAMSRARDKWKLWRQFKTWNEKRIDPAYMRRLSDEYRRVVPVNPAPHIFIGLATSPTNMCHIRWWRGWTDEYMGHSKSNQTAHIFVGSWFKPTNITLHLSDLGTTKIIQIYSPVPMILKRPTNEYIQRIFVGDVAKSTNIWGSQNQTRRLIYSSIFSPNRWI